MLLNHLLLIFKLYIYSAKNTKQLKFDNLKKIIKKIKELEKELTESNKMKLLKKCYPLDHIIDLYFLQSEKGGTAWADNFNSSLFLLFFSFFFICFFCNVHL